MQARMSKKCKEIPPYSVRRDNPCPQAFASTETFFHSLKKRMASSTWYVFFSKKNYLRFSLALFLFSNLLSSFLCFIIIYNKTFFFRHRLLHACHTLGTEQQHATPQWANGTMRTLKVLHKSTRRYHHFFVMLLMFLFPLFLLFFYKFCSLF